MSEQDKDTPRVSPQPPRGRTGDFFVVGIGASAGGVATLRQLFSHLQADCGMAFVVILHLSPQHESNLPSLIQNQTSVPVTQVNAAVTVEPNHIYVIPPGKYLMLADGNIRLTDPQAMRGSHTSIDLLFRTLADAYGKNAIAILLSGTGSDGVLGLRRIKEEGGFVIAEDPGEAEFPDMPRSAIDSGLVDLVMPVHEMVDKLYSLRDSAQRLKLPLEQEELPPSKVDETTLMEILTLLRIRTGHDFTHYKRPTLIRRIGRRIQVHELSELPAYLSYLHRAPAEVEALFRDLLITVTNFFRDRDAFDFLKREIIPKLFAGKGPDDQVRVWSAGCATGEEAYSLAILLSEYAARLPEPPKLQIFATDIDERAIAEARACRYPATIGLDVTPDRLQRFFVKIENGYQIRKELHEIVLFAVHNVLRDPPFSRLDLICCRNLLIYLNREIQARTLGTFHFALRTEGYLFLGASESAEITPSLFAPVDKKLRVYSRRPSETAYPVNTDWIASRWMPRKPELATGSSRSRSIGELHQEVVEQIAPPSILVNEDFDVEHISANAGRYLRFAGGGPTRNLLKLIHPELRDELHAALLEAKIAISGASVRSRRLRARSNGQSHWLILTVRPVLDRPEAAHGFLLITFDETNEPALAAEGVPDGDTDPGLDTICRLEEELRRSQEQLRLTVEQYETSMEELRASNEELQAINEELRSATEELETSKEELQSVNEELITVNHEYREKIDEVERANSDLQNLMASTDIGTIFLDRELQIKLYTPSAQRLFNITAADLGRPLLHFTNKLEYDSLSADAQEVLRTLQTIEREVHSADGFWYLARLLPYRTVDDRIDGVVLTFIDITGRRQSEEQLRQQAARLRQQAEIVDLGDLIVRDADDLILLWSAGCEQMYGYTREEAVGKNVHELLKTEFPRPLEEINAELRRNGQWQGELIHTGRAGKRIIVATRWVLHRTEPNGSPLILQINNDITGRREAEEALRQADRNKDQFLATLAHELRNPLSAMLSSIELLRRPSRTAQEVDRASDTLQRQIQHLLRLVDDLFDVERLAHGKIILQKRPCELSDIVDDAMQICRPLIDLSSHNFKLSLPSKPVVLDVDSDRIVQALGNLLHNAFKYTPPGGQIELSAVVDNSEVTIRVKDTGIGIAPEVLPYIFDMYNQGERLPGTELKGKGLGIGLALVRQLVELHGGRVVASSPGVQRGSEFVIHLPIVNEQPARQTSGTAIAQLPEGVSPGPRKVLIVDDHHDAAEALSDLLETAGHQVRTCFHGTAALQIAPEYQPGVVILDIGLPDMSGYEVARQLRELLPNVTLIALSGWLEENLDEAKQAGFDQYLTKPVQIAELQKLLAARPRGAQNSAN